jgi:hypothetical protein
MNIKLVRKMEERIVNINARIEKLSIKLKSSSLEKETVIIKEELNDLVTRAKKLETAHQAL